VIEVRDTGLGIAPEDMPHLFDRFYRGKLTWQVRGSGLGLAIIKEITEVHKGHVEVDSQAGVGSTFRVYLPIV
jgi:signal transduction histidine kinase